METLLHVVNVLLSVILVFLGGGLSHHDSFDLKPDAPSEIRGKYSGIRSNVTGLHVCELLPLHARVADKFALIRSIAHTFADHGGGHKRFLTGRDPFGTEFFELYGRWQEAGAPFHGLDPDR